MTKKEINNLNAAVAHMNDVRLEKATYEAIERTFGSSSQLMIAKGYSIKDISEAIKLERHLKEIADYYIGVCASRGIKLYEHVEEVCNQDDYKREHRKDD